MSDDGVQNPRTTRELTMLDVARVFAKRSTCARKQVGCVVTDEAMLQVLGIGYNGSARGLANHCTSDQPGECGCMHAELNALLKAPGIGPKKLFTTMAPCMDCAKAILNTFVTDVYYEQAYRNTDGIRLLDISGVNLWTPENLGDSRRLQRVTFVPSQI